MDKVLSLAELKESLREIYPALKEKYLVSKLGIFGSYGREEQNVESDLDILVTFEEPPSLFTFLALENQLSISLGVKVNLVVEDAIKPNRKKRILQEVQLI